MIKPASLHRRELPKGHPIAERIRYREVIRSPGHGLNGRSRILVWLAVQQGMKFNQATGLDAHRSSRAGIAMMLRKMQHTAILGDLAIQRAIRTLAIFPVQLEAEEGQVMILGTTDIEDAEDGNGSREGHRKSGLFSSYLSSAGWQRAQTLTRAEAVFARFIHGFDPGGWGDGIAFTNDTSKVA